MLLDLGDLRVRSWHKNDIDALVRYANNAKIAANLRDQFPHPYTRFAATAYLAEVRAAEVETSFAVEFAGEAIGGIGFKLGTDIARLSAEMGYWLGEPFWGRGLTTRAVLATSEWAFSLLQGDPHLCHGLLPQCGIDARAGESGLRARRNPATQRRKEWHHPRSGAVRQSAVDSVNAGPTVDAMAAIAGSGQHL